MEEQLERDYANLVKQYANEIKEYQDEYDRLSVDIGRLNLALSLAQDRQYRIIKEIEKRKR